MALPIWLVGFLLVSAFLSGLMDTIAGGGGIITVPALLLTGMPPALALGTNKLQASFGTFSAVLHFRHAGYLKLRTLYPGILSCLVGASLGTILVVLLPPNHLKPIVIVLLAGVILYGFLAKNLVSRSRARMPKVFFYLLFGFGLGFYDGFFGPGTGSFWLVALTFLLGYSIKQATIEAKVYNFVSNIISLVWFLVAGHVAFMVGIIMGVGQYIGAWCGAKLVMKKGAGVIMPVFRGVAILMFLMLIGQYWMTAL